MTLTIVDVDDYRALYLGEELIFWGEYDYDWKDLFNLLKNKTFAQVETIFIEECYDPPETLTELKNLSPVV